MPNAIEILSEEDQSFRSHVENFSQAVSQALEDFFGVSTLMAGPVQAMRGYVTSHRFQVSIPFTGTVQGEYILALDETLAGKLVGMYGADADEHTIVTNRLAVGAALSELMNTVVGQCIDELAVLHPYLTFLSPRLTIGERYYPPLHMFRRTLVCEQSALQCHFYVDLMRLHIVDTLEKTLAQVHTRELEPPINIVFDTGSTALIVIEASGEITRGSWGAAQRLLGVEPTSFGARFSRWISSRVSGGLDMIAKIEAWLHLAFSAEAVDAWKTQVWPLRPFDRVLSHDGRHVVLTWSPGRREGGAVQQVLVTMEIESARHDLRMPQRSIAPHARDDHVALRDWLLQLACEHRQALVGRIEELAGSTRAYRDNAETLHRTLTQLAEFARYPWNAYNPSGAAANLHEHFSAIRQSLLGVPQHLVEQAFCAVALAADEAQVTDAIAAVTAMSRALGSVTNQALALSWEVPRTLPCDAYTQLLVLLCEGVRIACTALADRSEASLASGPNREGAACHMLHIHLAADVSSGAALTWSLLLRLVPAKGWGLAETVLDCLARESEILGKREHGPTWRARAVGQPVAHWQWQATLNHVPASAR